MLVLITIGVVAWCFFVWGDVWGREAEKRERLEKDVLNREADLKVAKSARASLVTPSPIVILVLLLIVAVALCDGQSHFDAPRRYR